MSSHDGKIMNPATGRWISATGKIGKAILLDAKKTKEGSSNKQQITKKVKSHVKEQSKSASKKMNSQKPFTRHEIDHVDYLVLNTGFTDRLAEILAKDPKKCELRLGVYSKSDCEIVMLQSNQLEQTYTVRYRDGDTYVSRKEWLEISELVSTWDEPHDGVVVIRLNITSPFDALKMFHKTFGHGSKMDYCSPRVFDGMPIEEVYVYKRGDEPSDTKFMFMNFDSAYGN